MLRRALVLFVAVTAAATAAAQQCECGGPGAACCGCAFEPDDARCAFDLRARWCNAGGSCQGPPAGPMICQPPSPVSDQSPQPCGDDGQMCCPRGWCNDPALVCASGTCSSKDGVASESACGLDQSPCCGAYDDCDGDLVCKASVCSYVSQ